MSEKPPSGDDREDAAVGPGAELLRGREARRWSRREVADNLRLSEELIIALEEDDFAKLPAPIYVHGYLRNYARLLDIAAEPLIESFARVAEVVAPPIVSDLAPRGGAARGRAVTWISVVLALLMGAGFFTWWQGVGFVGLLPEPDRNDSQAPLADNGLAADSAISGTVLAGVAAGSGESAATPTGGNGSGGAMHSIAAPEAEPVVSEAPAMAATPAVEVPATAIAMVEAPVTEQEGDQVVVNNTPPARVDAAAQATPVSREDTQSSPRDSGDRLTLRLREDSWVEVDDAAGQRLIYDLLREGSARTVYGTAPFDIFLGNATAVAIELNQRQIDHSSHVRGNLARFTVAAQHNRVGGRGLESSSN